MNIDSELLNKALAEVLITFTQVKDFAIEQAPGIVKELLAYSTYMSYTWMWVCGFLTILFLILAIWNVLKHDSSPATVCFLLMAIFCVSTVVNFGQSMKIKLAPKVYILEYARTLVKQK